MKKIFFYIIITSLLWGGQSLLSGGFAHAQKTEGLIRFERQVNWIKMMKKLPFLTQEEKDRMEQTWKNDPDPKQKMNLYFNEKESLYTWGQEDQSYEDENWKSRNKELVFYRNFENEKRTDLIEILGKTYLVQDSLQKMDWKVMNQIKEVAGFICMKAVTEDKIKGQKITAWFTGDIPVASGPEQTFGLPGMILELDADDGTVMVTATTVEFKKLDKELVLPKLKGKKVNNKDFDAVVSKYINDSIKMQRNPYWAIRY